MRDFSIHQAWFFAIAAVPGTLEVCPDCPIQSIQKAIDQARPGATIRVKKGTYLEHPIVIDKPLHLIGDGEPVVDAQGKGHVLKILRAPDVRVSGFVLMNSGMSYLEELSGIRVIESPHCHIQSNVFLNDTFGVYLEKTDQCVVEKNRFEGTRKGEADSGNGIHIWYGSGHRIFQNDISGHRDGIYFEFVKDTQVIENRVHGNFRYGLHFMSSNQNAYEDNEFSENGAGVAVMYSKDIRMVRNRFVRNTGASAYGLLLKDIYSSEISDNLFEGNTTGVFMEGSNRSSFKKNVISKNAWGLRIMADCESNRFENNDFTKNTFDVTTNSSRSYNEFSENYWSQYDGFDLNQDGFGDRPFRPVSLSSVIIENVDSSFVLLNSFLLTLLDQVERALPVLIPEALKDERPLMRSVREAKKL